MWTHTVFSNKSFIQQTCTENSGHVRDCATGVDSATDIWGQIFLCASGCPVHRRVLSSIPGLQPRDAKSIHPLVEITKNVCGDCHTSPRSQNRPAEIHWTGWVWPCGVLRSFFPLALRQGILTRVPHSASLFCIRFQSTEVLGLP